MNVMAQAHKATKQKIAFDAANGLKSAPYQVIFKTKLREAHKEYKAMIKAKSNHLTEQRQKEIIQEGRDTFNAQQSSNPYKEGTHAHDLFLEGWLQAKKDFYNNQNRIVK